MDDCRFDELSRALARGTSRRRVLAGLVGGIVGGFAALRGSETDALAARRQAIGARCTRGAECASFHCVDGVCCDSPCTGQCESCASGACQPVSGAPAGNRPACPGSGDCAATCDGVTRNACVFPNSETVCGESACADGVQTTFSCAGNGTCHPTTTSCGLFECGVAGTCLTTCVSDDDCVGEAFCANGVCQGDLPAGQPCAGPDQCQSGLCVDAVCCAEACGDCETCNLPGTEGVCALVADGDSCGADGACCGGACCAAGQECIDGACQAPICRPPASFCATADQCCQDKPTFCEDVPRCGDLDEGRCCRPVGSTCIGFSCECCGFSDCVEGVCVETCSGAGFECFDDGHCCDDLICRDTICQEPAATCLAPQEACTSADQCCQDEPTNCEDVPANELQGPQCCRPRGGACTNRFLDCCGSDECIGGVCVEDCFGFGISCFVDDHCCDDLVCRDDRCQEPLICLAPPEACSSADQCCQDVPTFCEDVPLCGGVGEAVCCLPVGAACSSSDDSQNNSCQCCGSSFCFDDVCIDGCIQLGNECFADDQCCNGNCDNNVCACRPLGDECQFDTECCSENCDAGTCEPCRELGADCVFDRQCCSRSCSEGFVCVDSLAG